MGFYDSFPDIIHTGRFQSKITGLHEWLEINLKHLTTD